MATEPTIVGYIEASTPDGYANLRIGYTNHDNRYQTRKVTLYAWSDGVVTWTRTRDRVDNQPGEQYGSPRSSNN